MAFRGKWNVRTPDEVIGDIRSQIAANHVCAEKISQMLEEYGLEGLDDLADEIINRTEKSMREAISKVPDGVYRAEGIVEQGKGKDDIVIKVAVEVKKMISWWTLRGPLPGGLGRQCSLQFHLRLRVHGHEKHVRPGHSQQRRLHGPHCHESAPGECGKLQIPGCRGSPYADRTFYCRNHLPGHGGRVAGRVIAGSGGTPANMNVLYVRHGDGRPWHNVIPFSLPEFAPKDFCYFKPEVGLWYSNESRGSRLWRPNPDFRIDLQ